MDSDIYFILAIVAVCTLCWLLNVLWRLFPPAWMDVLADYEILTTYKSPRNILHAVHLLRLRYQFEGKSYEKTAGVRFSRRTLAWKVIPQPHDHIATKQLLIRVHPKKPHVIDYDARAWWHDAMAVLILGAFWTAIVLYFRKHGQL